MNYQQFRRLCLAQPEAEQVETWGEVTFRVGGKIFAIASPEGRSVSIKASHDDQAGLLALDPSTFKPAPYAGRFGWVSARLAGLGKQLGDRVVRNAWELTAPRRLVAASRPAAGSPGRRRTTSRSRAG